MQTEHEKLDLEYINGKPHFGIMLDIHLVFFSEFKMPDFSEDNPDWKKCIDILETSADEEALKKGLEIRHKKIDFRPGTNEQSPSLVIKYMLWGRAHKVMELKSQRSFYKLTQKIGISSI